MLTATHRLQPRGEDVVSKVIDGEAIIINLANGVYYSLEKVGSLVWEYVAAEGTVQDTIAAVEAHYDVSSEQAHTDVHRFLGELLAESLITVSDGGPAVPARVASIRDSRLSYESPALNIYRDMGDLLALDPPTPGLDSPWTDAGDVTS